MPKTGHVMKKMRTVLTAQGYAPDWPALELHFPEILGMKTYAEKWAYIEERCRESEEDAEFVRAHRPKLGDGFREVRDRVVTDDFCEFIVAQLQVETSAFGDFKYHHSGTGTNAENATDSALQTPELDARTVGTQVEGATAKAYKSIATETFDDTAAIIEHGLFNTAGAGGPPVTGGVLMDRTKLPAALNVVSGNQIQWTFEIALTSGG